MSDRAGQTLKATARLLRWYPRDWRARYGEEFAELLMADMAEQPRSWRRNSDVARSGLVARLAHVGLGGRALDPSEQVRAGLATFAWALAAFVTFGASLWSQLTIGWQWSEPDTTTTSSAMVVMTAAVALLCILSVLAVVPFAWHVVGCATRRRAEGLVRPSLLFVAGVSVLFVGARHFGNGWPGTGGHPWSHQGLVPGGVAAFTWASTLSISAYWAHPGSLLAFPAAEIAWMVVSPVAIGCLLVGAAKTLRRLELTPLLLRYEATLGRIATGGMILFLAGATSWVVQGGAGPKNLFRTGAIDAAALVVMVITLILAAKALRQTRTIGLARLPR